MTRGRTYAADNTARGYDEGIAAIRLEGIRAGRFLPRAGHGDEIKASPIVRDVRGDVRFTPESGHAAACTKCPRSAKSGHWPTTRLSYSIADCLTPRCQYPFHDLDTGCTNATNSATQH